LTYKFVNTNLHKFEFSVIFSLEKAQKETRMSIEERIQAAMVQHFDEVLSAGSPPLLRQAMHHALFPGGARIRPQLYMAVAMVSGEDSPEITDAGAVALELMHSASLVHDDMPCFDDAKMRRGKTTVHVEFSEPIALLTGDAMIVMAYQVLLNVSKKRRLSRIHANRVLEMMSILSESVGAPSGIVAGQAWECESKVDLWKYQRAKTGSLFTAATCMGAVAAGANPASWMELGESLGDAYQIADDIRDVICQMEQIGKPIGQDAHHGRPSAAQVLGLEGANAEFQRLIDNAVKSVPDCSGRHILREMILNESERLVPKQQYERYLELATLKNSPIALAS
jgi:geranylgeranyl diphosphate synthase type II